MHLKKYRDGVFGIKSGLGQYFTNQFIIQNIGGSGFKNHQINNLILLVVREAFFLLNLDHMSKINRV